MVEKTTRKIFHKIHQMQGDNQEIYYRLATLLSTEFLEVEPDFFNQKVCLDAGCGSNANATFNMLSMGAKKVFAFDLDDSIQETARKCLKQFEGRYELSQGSVLNIQFSDESFDFTHCAGVLHHTSDVFKGLQELTRVTKKGGLLYFDIYGQGGVIRDMTTLLRKKYAEEPEFKRLVDQMKSEDLKNIVRWLFSAMSEKNDSLAQKIPDAFLDELLDQDLVLTIQDRLQAPVYLENSEKELVDWLKANGFTKIERLTKYPRFKNVRRFLSPIYDQYKHPVSRFLYGSGQIQIKAIKD